MRNQRYIDHCGYACVKVPGHPHATTNDWAREHRVIMSNLLGRPLRRDEVVHHKDGNRSNNESGNLELLTKGQHVRVHMGNPKHRQEGEANPIIGCTCGCGQKFKKYDNRGRPRKFLHGHNSGGGAPTGERHGQAKLTNQAVLEIRRLWESNACSKRELGKAFGVTVATIGNIVRRETWRHI